jgi:hypothetical protein
VWLGRSLLRWWRWAWDHTIGAWEEEISVLGKIGIGLLIVAGWIITAVVDVLPQWLFWAIFAGGFVLFVLIGWSISTVIAWRHRNDSGFFYERRRRHEERLDAERKEGFRRAQERLGRRPGRPA